MKEMKYASFSIRLLARLFDMSLMWLVNLLILFLLSANIKNIASVLNSSLLLLALLVVSGLFFSVVYYSYFTSAFGGTLGKLLFGLRVEDEEGKNLSFKMSFFRHTVGYMVSNLVFGLGYYWVIRNKETRQGWHDGVSHSFVVVKGSNIAKSVLGSVLIIFLLFMNTVLVLAIAKNISSSVPVLKKEVEGITKISEVKNVTEMKPPTQTPPINSLWSEYKNSKAGFSIKVPRYAVSFSGGCKYVSDNGDHSYRPVFDVVPLQILEDGNDAYVTASYLYELSGETVENSHHYYSKCDKVFVSLDKIKATPRSAFLSPLLKFSSKNVLGDVALEQFVKDNYGKGCKLGEKTEIGDIFSVSIANPYEVDGSCYVNYMYSIRYSPAKNMVVAWNLGQACNFPYPTRDTCQDFELAESFRFE